MKITSDLEKTKQKKPNHSF